ncbi:unnamed protein product [Plutella xylostella]|uniref:(diamondback moth) hypothetical protein n=1 Tax=Plutella xylostella TaxID=51655 RepID=A0A8S4D2Y2_PLUXY|nr:unnamed protein product [Plutella xylostella]
MSFGLPSVKVKPEHVSNVKVQEGPFGVPDPFVAGMGATKPKLGQSHPLEHSEKNYHLNVDKMNLAMLRNVQGLHAPMRLQMERKFASKIGHLPFLPRSNMQMEVLTGRHVEIGFEDILNVPEFCEVSGQPHAMVERSLGLL